MPKPVGQGQRYLPGLDGLRAIAVAVVVAYHLGLGWASGGLLGVGVFFTLSGYLITDILVGQWRATSKINLKDFWLRRARRLLPALFAVLAVVGGWVALGYPGQFAAVRGDIVAAALYVSNWWFIVQDASYFARFGPPSPVGHLWSLAVEEQFYLIWPWLVLAGCLAASRWSRPGSRRARHAGIAVTLALATASFVALALAFHPGVDPTRAYEGTDTRAGGLLVGAALAVAWPTRQRSTESASRKPALLDALGVVGLIAIALLIWRTNEYSAFMFRGGMVALSVATALVIAAVVHPAGRLGRILGAGPLRWLGVRSYGIYLWHYPLIVLLAPGGNPDGQPESGLWQLSLAGLCVAVAALSWWLIEDPIRSRQWPRLPAPATGRAIVTPALDVVRWARGGWLRTATAGAMALGVAGVMVTGGLVLAGRLSPSGQSHSVLAGESVAGAGGKDGLGSPAVQGVAVRGGHGSQVQAPTPWYGSLGPTVTAAQAAADARLASPASEYAYADGLPQPQPRTSCTSVVHIGDSTSEGLISSDYLPNPAQRIPARYAQVGVSSVHMEVVGGTSIIEEYDNKPNAFKVATRYVKSGYHGCWVLALGTNDTADVAVGSNVGVAARIAAMMSAIGNQPVLWVTVRSQLSSGPYSEHNMQLWDQALYAAQSQYPNMRIYDWASVVQGPWFISDEIHFTSAGYAARGELIADALAAAFPATGPAAASASGHPGSPARDQANVRGGTRATPGTQTSPGTSFQSNLPPIATIGGL